MYLFFRFGIYHMESFGSNYDECSDSSKYKLRSEECCYPYHLISFCIYKERTKIASKKQKTSCVKHLEQSKYMVPISSVDKLISKNLHKMEKTSISIVQEKIIKIENDYHEKSIMNSRRKNKINWNECFPERRRSRRLSNLPPIDDIKIEVENEDISLSFDNISYNLLSRNEQIKDEKILNTENNIDYIEGDVKLEPIDNVDAFQDDNMDICENILNDNSNFTQINNSCANNILNNTYGTLFNLETTYLKSTDTYHTNTNDNINLNQENHKLPKIIKCWSKSVPNQYTFYETDKILETSLPNIIEAKEIPPVPKTHSEITKIEQIPPLSKTYYKPTETKNNSSLPRTYSRMNKNKKIPPLPRKNVEVIETKDISSIPETCSETLEIDEMPSLFKNHFGITEIKNNMSVPVTTETYTEIIDTENISSLPKTIGTENISFLSKKNSINTEAKEIQSQHETYSEIIDTEQMSSLSETHSEIMETEEVSTIAYSGIAETNKSFPLPEKNVISYKTKEMPPSTEAYIKIIETEKTPSQFETFLEITDPNEMAYYPETFEIREIPCPEDMYSNITQMQNSSSQPEITIINGPSGHKTYHNNLIVCRQFLPKIENKRSEYSKMTLREKVLYRKKLTFVTALGLVSKEKLKEMSKKNNKRVAPVISKKKSSYSKVTGIMLIML